MPYYYFVATYLSFKGVTGKMTKGLLYMFCRELLNLLRWNMNVCLLCPSLAFLSIWSESLPFNTVTRMEVVEVSPAWNVLVGYRPMIIKSIKLMWWYICSHRWTWTPKFDFDDQHMQYLTGILMDYLLWLINRGFFSACDRNEVFCVALYSFCLLLFQIMDTHTLWEATMVTAMAWVRLLCKKWK